MKPHDLVREIGVGLALAVLVVASAGLARAAPSPADSTRALRHGADSLGAEPLALARAVAARRSRDTTGVIESLESLDFTRPAAFAEADRAAFLLGLAWLERGNLGRFEDLARSVARWPVRTPYTRWIALELAMLDSDGARLDSTGMVADSSLQALASTTPSLALALRARSLAARGGDDTPALAELAAADTSTRLGRDLAGEARLRLATREIRRGGDPVPWLEGVAWGSRYATRARHLLGQLALERGDTTGARAAFEPVIRRGSGDAEIRAVRLALAGQSLDAHRWAEAESSYRALDLDWSQEDAALRAMLASGGFDSLWTGWNSGATGTPLLALDAAALTAAAESLASASADLDRRPVIEPPALDSRVERRWRWPVSPPPAEAMASVRAAERQLGEQRDELERARRDVERERQSLGDRRRYLTTGLGRARDEQSLLEERKAELDSLRRILGAINERLAAVRDSATLHLSRRLERIVATALDHELWMNAMRFYYLGGPAVQHPLRVPPGLPGPDSVLIVEQELAGGIEAVAESLAVETPTLIARSYRDAWRPGLIGRADTLGVAAGRLLARALAVDARIDSSAAATASSLTLRRRAARELWLEACVDSLAKRCIRLRDRVAAEAIETTLAHLNDQREAVDYGLASSTYGLAIQLGQTDSLAGARAPSATADSMAMASEVSESPEIAGWRTLAIERMRAFLDRHPRSESRGETRFRLADLLLVEARQEFRESMARYLEAQSAGRPPGRLPVLDDRPALDLYVTMLREDSAFPHRDAVLFNAAMILADDGDPAAVPYFQELVSEHPDSPYCQESYLRMADLSFDDRAFQRGVALYERAAAGPDTSLNVTALYKMGWAEYNSERFLEAVDAFRRVLDIYAAPGRGSIQVDVRKEAESDLIQAMARAGRARAFAMYFDTLGTRPYEMRLLGSLAAYQRRYSLFTDAAASEELALARYPHAPEALDHAQWLIETYRRDQQPARVRDALLKYSSQFAPGSEWALAQASDSVRAAGSRFARSGLEQVALEHHLAARKTQNAWEWREALQLYQTILAHWPDDPEAPTLELDAGEASARIGDFPQALALYAAAAKSGPDSVASLALWQRVAVSDSWYEASRRAATGPHPLGSDSLARTVIEAADQLLERYPQHPRGADLLWREGNLAFAHGWYERSGGSFQKLAVAHPSDPRAPFATMLRADGLLRMDRFEDAGAAYEQALVAARTAGVDSLARRAERAIPICYYREAEAAVATDSTAFETHARLFEKVATRFPHYAHADLAEYRAALAYRKAGQTEASVLALQTLIDRFPSSEYVRDAHLEIAKEWEARDDQARAAQGYADFVRAFPSDSLSRDAWLKAADLFGAAGLTDRADSLHLAYVRRYPDDVAAAMGFLEELSRRELKTVTPQHPISRLLAYQPPTLARPKKTPATSNPKTKASSAPSSHLEQYMKLAAAHPDLASRPLIAEIRFDQGEEAFVAYTSAALRQPLERSIPAKQRLLDAALSRFRDCVNVGVPDWSHASTYRIGQALVGFGEALEKSEPPADIKGDDLAAYDQVLRQQAQPFYDRGEGVWAELLRHGSANSQRDAWLAQAQDALFHRMANRFLFHPEAEYPLVAAVAVDKLRPAKAATNSTAKSKPRPRDEADRHGSGDRTAGASSQGSQP